MKCNEPSKRTSDICTSQSQARYWCVLFRGVRQRASNKAPGYPLFASTEHHTAYQHQILPSHLSPSPSLPNSCVVPTANAVAADARLTKHSAGICRTSPSGQSQRPSAHSSGRCHNAPSILHHPRQVFPPTWQPYASAALTRLQVFHSIPNPVRTLSSTMLISIL
jgi:hypothetical protein